MNREEYIRLLTELTGVCVESAFFSPTRLRVVMAYRTDKLRIADIARITKTLRTKKHARALCECIDK
jgi:hypothetical protein